MDLKNWVSTFYFTPKKPGARNFEIDYTKSKIFAPLFLYDPVGWLLQFFIGRKNMY